MHRVLYHRRSGACPPAAAFAGRAAGKYLGHALPHQRLRTTFCLSVDVAHLCGIELSKTGVRRYFLPDWRGAPARTAANSPRQPSCQQPPSSRHRSFSWHGPAFSFEVALRKDSYAALICARPLADTAELISARRSN